MSLKFIVHVKFFFITYLLRKNIHIIRKSILQQIYFRKLPHAGIDWGGLRREWVELICASLFEPVNGLFCTFHDKRQALVHPNPNRPASQKLKYYEFAGKIVGKCLYGE